MKKLGVLGIVACIIFAFASLSMADCKEEVGATLYGLVVDDTGKWTVIVGHIAKVNKELKHKTGNVYTPITVPFYSFKKPSNVPNTGTLYGNDNNIFCSERAAWEEANRRNGN